MTHEYSLFLTPSGLRDKAKGERAAWSPGYKFHFSCCRFRLKLEGAGDACLPLRQCVRVVKEMDSKSIGLCPQGFESPRCRFSMLQWKHHFSDREDRPLGNRGTERISGFGGFW